MSSLLTSIRGNCFWIYIATILGPTEINNHKEKKRACPCILKIESMLESKEKTDHWKLESFHLIMLESFHLIMSCGELSMIKCFFLLFSFCFPRLWGWFSLFKFSVDDDKTNAPWRRPHEGHFKCCHSGDADNASQGFYAHRLSQG